MYPHQIPAYAPGTSLLPQGMLQGGAGHLSQLPLKQGIMGQSGGFLSKLIGGAKAGGGGITNIMNMLQNAQKTIGTIQSFGPMIQQYGPLVKSLPSLIGVMKGSGSSTDEHADDEKKVVKVKNTSKESPKKSVTKNQPKKKTTTINSQIKTKQKKTKKNSTAEISKGIPAPKLYI